MPIALAISPTVYLPSLPINSPTFETFALPITVTSRPELSWIYDGLCASQIIPLPTYEMSHMYLYFPLFSITLYCRMTRVCMSFNISSNFLNSLNPFPNHILQQTTWVIDWLYWNDCNLKKNKLCRSYASVSSST